MYQVKINIELTMFIYYQSLPDDRESCTPLSMPPFVSLNVKDILLTYFLWDQEQGYVLVYFITIIYKTNKLIVV